MISRHKYKTVDWIDLELPSEEEVRQVADEFKLHTLLVSELSRPSERAKVDLYSNYMYLILHFPKYKHGGNRDIAQELDFVIGKNFIITSHYEPIDVFFDLSKSFETGSILDKAEDTDNSGYIFYHIMKKLYDNLEHELDHVTRDLAQAEREIFIGNELKMVQVLSNINKALIDFKRPLKMHHEILNSFDDKEEKLLGTKFNHFTEIIIGEYKRVWTMLESNKEVLMDLRNTNDSLFSAKTNSIMKNLTIMSFLTFPLTLMVGILDMNTASNPLAGTQNQFWIVLSIMGATTFFILLLFKYEKWI
ncbi:MAG: hypothetical protein HY226_03440 [Candidatus Vogelbacteria bacterium]|nr:hypothetical protein [Candidatus Vogelbacteria bacterium]